MAVMRAHLSDKWMLHLVLPLALGTGRPHAGRNYTTPRNLQPSSQASLTGHLQSLLPIPTFLPHSVERVLPPPTTELVIPSASLERIRVSSSQGRTCLHKYQYPTKEALFPFANNRLYPSPKKDRIVPLIQYCPVQVLPAAEQKEVRLVPHR
jgi:hypothetical protein